MNRPKIGIVTAWYERGAGMVSRTYRRLLQETADVAIYARGGLLDAKWDADGNVYRAETFGGVSGTGIDLQEFNAWLKREEIDLLIFNEQQDARILYHLTGRLPLIGYVDFYTPETVPVFELYDALLCHTRRHAEAFAWHPGMVYIPWCVFPEDIRCEPAETEPVFVHSAGWLGIGGRKGTAEAITAFRHLPHEDARLFIAAQVEMKDLGAALCEEIRNDSRIQFHEGNFATPEPYVWGNVCVYPAKLDGLGLTVYEAMASGRPVIAPCVAPYTEIVSQNYSGSLVRTHSASFRDDGYYWPERPVDVRNLVDVMNRYVEHPEVISEQGRNAAEFMRENRTWSSQQERFVDAVLNTITGFKKPSLLLPAKQISVRYEKPDVLTTSEYYLWRPILETISKRPIRTVLLIVEELSDGKWLRKVLKSCTDADVFDLAVGDGRVAGEQARGLFSRIFDGNIDTALYDAKDNWDLVVVWKTLPNPGELRNAAERAGCYAVACEPAVSKGESKLAASGYRIIPSPPSRPAIAHRQIGIFEIRQRESELEDCGQAPMDGREAA